MAELPTITIVFLVFNRREELRISLNAMREDSDYPPELVDVVVVDNASTDGSAEMVRESFPDVRLVERTENIGVSAWNDGFAVAGGEWVLALDDDCYLPPDGLRRAVESARAHDADLVSFRVVSDKDPSFVFTELYETGLLSFWGCSVLIRRSVIDRVGGFNPDIFVWAHEMDFMLRFFDAGFRHLHLPEVSAVHMSPIELDEPFLRSRRYRVDVGNVAYIVGRYFRARDAAGAVGSMIGTMLREAARIDPAAIRALPHCLKGFARGLTRRTPVRNPAVSRMYRRNMRNFAGPLVYARRPHEFVTHPVRRLAGRLTGRPVAPPRGRRDDWFAERSRYYPATSSTLQL
jgi:GT2 family glycosyltransferase